MLVVDVVVLGVVAGNELKRIPWESVSAVVVDSLDCGHGEEQNALAECHTGDLECDGGTKGIEKETLNGVVVESTIGVRHIETVVAGVEVSCQLKLAFTKLNW